jgi:hypothetical protein
MSSWIRSAARYESFVAGEEDLTSAFTEHGDEILEEPRIAERGTAFTKPGATRAAIPAGSSMSGIEGRIAVSLGGVDADEDRSGIDVVREREDRPIRPNTWAMSGSMWEMETPDKGHTISTLNSTEFLTSEELPSNPLATPMHPKHRTLLSKAKVPQPPL